MGYPRVAGHDWDRLSLLNYSATHTGKSFFDIELATTGGGASPTIDAHVDGGGRASLQCSVDGVGKGSEVRVKLWELRPPQLDGSYKEEFDSDDGGQYHEFDVYFDLNDASPRFSFWRILDSGANQLASVVYNAGKWRTNVGGNQVDETIGTASAGQHYTVTVFYKPAATGVADSGEIRLWVDGTEITDVRQTHSDDTAYAEIRLGIVQITSGTSGNDCWYNWHELVVEDVYDEFSDLSAGGLRYRDRGLGQIRETGERWASIFVHWNPGVHKAAWFVQDDVKFRFYGHVLGTSGQGVAGPYEPSRAEPFGPLGELYKNDDHVDIVTIEGLQPDTDYIFKVRCFREGNEATDYYESSHVIRLKTRQTSRKQSYLIGIGHCQDQGQYLKHWRYWKDRGCRQVLYGGDMLYNDRGGSPALPHVSDEVPVANYKEYIRATHRVTWDRFFAEYSRQGQVVEQGDDHDYMDNKFKASYRKASSDTRINPSGSNGSDYDAGTLSDDPTLAAAGVTVQDLWDANRPGFKKVWSDGFAPSARGGTTADNEEHFRVHESRDILFAILDTRGYQDENGTEPTSGGNATMLGAGQLAYWRNKFQNTQKPIVVILSGGAWCDLAGGSDNWKDIAPAERILLEQDLENNPNVRAVLITCGDRHYTLIDRRRNDGQNSRSGFTFSKMIASVQIGPALRSIMPAYQESWETETDVLFAWDQDVPAGRYAAMSGTMLINESNNSVRLVVFSGLDNSTYYDQTFTWEPCSPNRGIPSATQLLVQEENSWSEAVTDGSMAPIGVEFTAETLRSERQLAEPDSRMGVSGRMIEDPKRGNVDVRGSIRGELQLNGFWPLVLKHALGTPVTSGSGLPYEHILLGSNTLAAGLTFEKWIYFKDGTRRYIRYTGCKVDRFALTVEQNQMVLAEAEFIGYKEEEVTTPLSTPNYPVENDPYTAHEGAVYFDLTGNRDREPVGTVQTISLDIANNLHADDYSPSAGAYRRALTPGQRLINGSARIMLTEAMMQVWEQFVAGTVLALEWRFTRGKKTWQWFLPRITLTGSPTPKMSLGPSYIDIAFRASRDAVIGSDIRCIIRNTDPVISTAT